MTNKTKQQGVILDKFSRPCTWGNISMFTAQPKRHYFDVQDLEGKTVDSYSDIDGDGLWCLALVCERQYISALRLQGNVDPQPMYAICAAAVFKNVIPEGVRYIALASTDSFSGGRMGDSKELGKLLNSNEIPILFDEGCNALSRYYANTLCRLGQDILAHFTLRGARLTYDGILPSAYAYLYPTCKIAGYDEIYDVAMKLKLLPNETSRSSFSEIVEILSYGMISTIPPKNLVDEEQKTYEKARMWERYITFQGCNVSDEKLKDITQTVCDMLKIWENRLSEANLSFSETLDNLDGTHKLAEVGRTFGIDRDIAALIAKVPVSDIICV